MLSRFSLVLTLLLGLLPYVSTIKRPPIPSFWAEWIAAALACCWLIWVGRDLRRAQGATGTTITLVVPSVVLGFAALSALLLIQLVAKIPLFRGAPLLTIPVLLLAGMVCMAGEKLRAAGEATRVLDMWAIALVLALALNFATVLLQRQGVHIYIHHFGFRPYSGRAEGLVGQPNQLAVMVTMAGAAANYLWMRDKLSTWLHILLSLAGAFVVGATGSRAGLLLWMIGAVLAALALRDHPRRAVGRRLLFVGIVAALAAQILLPWMDAAATVLAVGRGEGRGRIELWRDSWALIKLHPLIGVGYGNFMAARWTELSGSLLEPSANHSHNLITQLAVELGLPGAALVLIPLGWSLWRCVVVAGSRTLTPQQYLAVATTLLIAGYAMVEFPLWYTFFLLPLSLMLGLVGGASLTIRVSRPTPVARVLGWGSATALLTLVVLDYQRNEELYTSVYLQLQEHQGEAAAVRIPLQEAANASNLSAFDVYANLMFARTMSPDGLFMGYKLDVIDRAMLTMTNEETVGRKISFLVAKHDNVAAMQLWERTYRSHELEMNTRKVLGSLSSSNPALGKFVSGLPAVVNARSGNNQLAPSP